MICFPLILEKGKKGERGGTEGEKEGGIREINIDPLLLLNLQPRYVL